MKEHDHIQFQQGLPFYDMVMSFMTSLSAVTFVLNNEKLDAITDDDYVSIEGNWVEARHFYPISVVNNLREGKFELNTFVNSCCCMLANSAFESVKRHNDKTPEFELLRHIRNASSHQNRFTFNAKEPAAPAYWRRTTIEHDLKGEHNPLFGTECFGAFFGVPDIIDLLKEIEKKMIKQAL